jgi:hypothetical protein
MLECNFVWQSTGSSGGLTAIRLDGFQAQSVLQIQYSTLATTQSVSFQTAQESTGPWFIEASTSISTAASTCINLRVTGPFTWMRPYLHTASTGTYQFRLIAQS